MARSPRGEGCHAAGCSEHANRDGFCQFHWRRWRKFGDPLAGGPPKPRWGSQTDSPAYRTVHQRLTRWHGQPALCDECGTTEAKWYDWALKADAKERRFDHHGFPYSSLFEDYRRLCKSCHIIQDRYTAKERVRGNH